MKLTAIKIFKRLGDQFNLNVVQFLNKEHALRSFCNITNSQKGGKTKIPKPNLRVPNRNKKNSYELPGRVGPYGYFLLSIPIATFLLGTWQVQRRRWKLDLLANMNARIIHKPIQLPTNLEELASKEYYPVKVKGTFMYEKEFLVGLRTLIVDGKAAESSFIGSSDIQKGYCVVTPFKLSDQDLTILVNRGWVPKQLRNPVTRQESQVKEEVEITGILRLNEARPSFFPKNSPKDDIWYYRDVNTMARKAETAPVYIEMVRDKNSSKYPVGGQTIVKLRNEHLSYIFTWYSLSALTSYMWYKQIFQRVQVLR